VAGYAGGVIGSGTNAKDYHKSTDLGVDSLDSVDSPLQGFETDGLISTSKNARNDFKMDDILVEMKKPKEPVEEI
jgi:hypothetical protein